MGFLSNLFGGKRKQAIIDALVAGGKVIDVRTAAEFRSGHVEGSINIPLDKLQGSVNKLQKMNKPLVLCCASGARSAQAVSILKYKGLQDVHNGGSWFKVDRILD